jgi:serine/threonine protein kinase
MNERSVPSLGPAGDLIQARMIASQVKGRWNEGEIADAQAALLSYPDLTRHKSIVLDLAYEEFCQRLEVGESVSVEAFCDNFPTCRESLQRLLQVHQLMHRDPELLALSQPLKWPEPGDNVLGFDLDEEIGRGAFARVYRARERSLGNRPVVVKVTCDGHAEADILGRLRHPNIVQVHSIQSDEDAGYVVICMPFLGRATLADVIGRVFIAGGRHRSAAVLLNAIDDVNRDDGCADPIATSDRLLRKGAFVDRIVDWAAQLAEGLAYAHGSGICHRDIKPSNILVAPGGRPMLLDFNLSQDEHAVTPRVGGTLPYMSPEQIEATMLGCRASSDVDARSDVFSLGVVLYEALTGQLPFGPFPANGSLRMVAEQLHSSQRKGPVALQAHAIDVDRSLASVIERCLHFDPNARFQSAEDFARQLRRQLSIVGRLRRGLKRHRRSSAFAATLLLVSSMALQQWIAHRPSYAMREYDAGVQLAAAHDYDDAVKRFTQAITADDNLDEALRARGRAHQKLGKFKLAIDDYLAASNRRPSPELTAAVGYCFNKLRDHLAAAKYYESALAQGVNTVAVMNNLGYSLLQLKKAKESRHWLTEAIRLSSDVQAPFVNRAVLDLDEALHNKGSIPLQGMEDIRRAVKIGPESGELFYFAAWLSALSCQRDRSLSENALDFLGRAVDCGFDPDLLRNNPHLSALAGNARYQALFQRAKGPKAKYPVERLVPIEP